MMIIVRRKQREKSRGEKNDYYKAMFHMKKLAKSDTFKKSQQIHLKNFIAHIASTCMRSTVHNIIQLH